MKNLRNKEPGYKGQLAKGFIATGLAASALAGCSADSDSTPRPTVTVMKTVEVAPTKAETGLEIEKNRDSAIEAAMGVISILQDKASTTTKEYRGNYVGNKDAERPANVPESFITFNHETGAIYVSAANGYNVVDGHSTAGFEEPIGEEAFTLINISLEVNRDNNIYDASRQLTLDDFKDALAQKDTVSINKIEGSWYEGGSIPGARLYELIVDEAGVSTRIDENGDGAMPYELEPALNDQDSVDRVMQIVGASVQDFKSEMRE